MIRVRAISLFSACLATSGWLVPASHAVPPAPLVEIEGEVRNFSPNGSSMVAMQGNRLTLYDTRTWQPVKSVAIEGVRKRPEGVLIDNKRIAAVMHENEAGQITFEIVDLYNTPKLLAREVAKSGRSMSLDQKGLLVINGIAVYPVGKKEVYPRDEIGWIFVEYYHVRSYSMDLITYLTTAKKLDLNLNAATAPAVLRQNPPILKYTDINAMIDLPKIKLTQTDLQIDWDVYAHTGAGEYGKPDMRKAAAGLHFIYKESIYGFATNQKASNPVMLAMDTGHLKMAGQWMVKADDLAKEYPLTHLEAPGFVPSRVSGSGTWVAFTDGSSSRVYSSETITNPFANLSAKMAEDALRTRIASAIKEQRHEDAVPYFRRLWKLGNPQKEILYIRWAETLEKSDMHQEARAAAQQYISKFGDSGEYYSAAIKILSQE